MNWNESVQGLSQAEALALAGALVINAILIVRWVADAIAKLKWERRQRAEKELARLRLIARTTITEGLPVLPMQTGDTLKQRLAYHEQTLRNIDQGRERTGYAEMCADLEHGIIQAELDDLERLGGEL